jgi:hypothetical protein
MATGDQVRLGDYRAARHPHERGVSTLPSIASWRLVPPVKGVITVAESFGAGSSPTPMSLVPGPKSSVLFENVVPVVGLSVEPGIPATPKN